jgi:hypothetical protein
MVKKKTYDSLWKTIKTKWFIWKAGVVCKDASTRVQSLSSDSAMSPGSLRAGTQLWIQHQHACWEQLALSQARIHVGSWYYFNRCIPCVKKSALLLTLGRGRDSPSPHPHPVYELGVLSGWTNKISLWLLGSHHLPGIDCSSHEMSAVISRRTKQAQY